MFVPSAHAVSDSEVRELVAAVGAAELISVDGDGYPLATRLPLVWRGDSLIFHMARANRHWRSIQVDQPALAVVSGPEAYISASWYAEKQISGAVAPTWNYSAVQFRGRLSVHHERDWLLDALRAVTEVNEQPREQPWSIDEAPQEYLNAMVRGIVGVQLHIEHVDAKAKLSQNKSAQDQTRVVEELRRSGLREQAVAEQMQRNVDRSQAH